MALITRKETGMEEGLPVFHTYRNYSKDCLQIVS